MVACNLYFTLPFGQIRHSRNPIIITLARSLGRTPGSVAMKLVNFVCLTRPIKPVGFQALAVLVEPIAWYEEFRERWTASAYESEKGLHNLLSTQTLEFSEDALALRILQAKSRPTESLATVQIQRCNLFSGGRSYPLTRLAVVLQAIPSRNYGRSTSYLGAISLMNELTRRMVYALSHILTKPLIKG